MKISEFKERDRIKQPLFVVGLVNGTSNSGQAYLSLTLQDNSGTIEGKLWDVKEDLAKRLKVGHIVEVEADVIKYKASLQLKLQSIEIVNPKNYELSDFVITSSISKDVLIEKTNQYINSISNEILAKLVKSYFEIAGSDYYTYPAAAKNHHEFIGGLATHTLEMLDIATFICKQYPYLDRDLLISGILLHDIGKIEEYKGPMIVEYSTVGKLIGHISIAQAKLYEIAKSHHLEDTEEVLLLRHMILSHHGQYEYGSPVLPMIAEAEALNLIDNLSARMTMFEKHLQTVDKGEFSTRVFSLEGRSIYRHQEEIED